jgi:hypothetical protein
LKEISGDPDVADALFELLETQRILDNKPKLTLFMNSDHSQRLADLLASGAETPPPLGGR